MNEFQRKQICQLRKDGMGYRTIATEVGLTRDVVRNFCRKYGIDGYIGIMGENIRREMIGNALCVNCATPIKQPKTGRPRRFCSEHCRRSWWNDSKHKDEGVRKAFYNCTCTYCGIEFLSYGKKDRKYCSHKCYIKDRFGVKKDLKYISVYRYMKISQEN